MSSIELWPKQQEALDFALSRDEVALLCEQRTGKTFITLKMASCLRSLHEAKLEKLVGVVVTLLNNKESTWGDGFGKYLDGVEIHRDLDTFRKSKEHRILMVHYEQFVSIIAKLCKYKKTNWVVIDEAHRLYNRGSKQSRAAARMSWVTRKMILTGTPMEKRPTDFFGQFLFLKPEVFGKRYADFEEKWLDWKKIDMDYKGGPRPGGPAYQKLMLQQRILKSKAKFKEELLDEFVDLLEPYCFRMEKVDVGILPPTIKTHGFDLPPGIRGIYRQMEEDSLATMPNGDVLAAQMPMTRVMKLRQFSSGFYYNEDEETVVLTRKRIRFALDLFEDLPKPVVLFAAFIPEVLELHRALEASGYDVGLVYGGIPKKKRPAVWRAFQAGQLDAVVCQTSAGGVGVDLWKGNHAIMYSMSYSSILWDQALSRLDSRDKKEPSTIHLIKANGTIDEDLIDLVVKKGNTTRSVLSQLKRRYRHGQGTDRKDRRKSKASAARPRAAEVQHQQPDRRPRHRGNLRSHPAP